MDCLSVTEVLPDYYFGTCAVGTEVDAHLLGCNACLQRYFRLKRGIEDEQVAPSEAARLALRARVQARFQPRARWRSLVVRPIPLYQSVAAAVAAVAILLVAEHAPRSQPQKIEAQGQVLFDGARAEPLSASFY